MVYKRLERILIHLDEVDSTNDYATELIKSSFVSNGTTILTNHQLNGRGQRSAVWTSQAGKNLTFSTIIFPEVDAKRVFYLNVIASLAVYKVLEDIGLSAKIKWPNDVLINDKKVCGILVENVIFGNKINSAVIGIGFNVNQIDFGLLPSVTSLRLEKEVDFELLEVFEQLYGYLDFYYNLFCESNFKVLKSRYYEKMYRFNELSSFLIDGKKKEGRVKGISESGLLLVEIEGKQKTFDIKEIQFI